MQAAAQRPHYRATFAVLSTAVMAYALLQSLVLPVLPTIQHGLHTSQNNVTWVLTAYLLSASIFTPIIGRFGDMWGKERFLVLALIVLAVGCVLSALATSLPVMVTGRVIQGVGGGVIPLTFGIIRDEFPAEKVAGAVGTAAALTAAGAGLGLVLAGPVVNALDYHWLFWFPMIMLIVAAVAAKLVVPKSPVRVAGRVNAPAAILLAAWLVALLVPISEGSIWGWGSVRVIGSLVLAALLAAAWMLVEIRSREPLIDMRMMRVPVVWTANLVALLFGVGMYSIFAVLPEFLQTPHSAGYGFGVSITESGLILLPLSVTMFIFGAVSGRLTVRYGGRNILIGGAFLAIVPFGMLVVAHGQQWEILLSMALMGASFGLVFSAMSNLIVAGVPTSQTGVASGMNANIRTIGGSIGAAVVSSVVTSGAHGAGPLAESGYTHGFEVLAVASVFAAAATLVVPRSVRALRREELQEALPHAELGLVAAGTLVGDEPE
jgi:MFS family permease